ncbi:hypothetical protein [Haloarchaeobius sp. DFWS5]|uniref:hypothetical protein n=1 Tax=Haloarchaeobius sp. DFWS5 TaxID=3446114 RepID=UPI003EB9EBAE
MRRLRLVLGCAVFLSSILVLQGTGAFELTQTDEVGEGIELAPHPGPNGQYAYYDAGGELALDFGPSNPHIAGDGLNVRAQTYAADVFTVTNNGSHRVQIWLSGGHPLGRFVARGSVIETETNGICLDPGEHLAVGVRFDTTDEVIVDVRASEFTVNAVRVNDSGAPSHDSATVFEGPATVSDDPVSDSEGPTTVSDDPVSVPENSVPATDTSDEGVEGDDTAPSATENAQSGARRGVVERGSGGGLLPAVGIVALSTLVVFIVVARRLGVLGGRRQ